MGSERKKSKKFSEPTKNTDNFRVFVRETYQRYVTVSVSSFRLP